MNWVPNAASSLIRTPELRRFLRCLATIALSLASPVTALGGSWQQQTLTGPDQTSTGDAFGQQVWISDGMALVSSPFETVNGQAYEGTVYVYRKNPLGNWVRSSQLKDPVMGAHSEFGSDFHVFGGRAYVTSAYALDSNHGAGAVSVFQYANGTWTLVERIYAPGTPTTERFSPAMDVSAGYLFVGGTETSGSTTTPVVYIYKWNALLGSWVYLQLLTSPDPDNESACYGNPNYPLTDFGAIAITDSHAFIGDCTATVGGNGLEGIVWEYALKGSTWEIYDVINPNDARANDMFGTSLAVLGDDLYVGSLLAYGAGAVYVFHSTLNGWTQDPNVIVGDSGFLPLFGASISVRSDSSGGALQTQVLVGAVGLDTFPDSSVGAAYLFLYGPKGAQQLQKWEVESNGQLGIGGSVWLDDEDQVIVGEGDDAGNVPGAAYVFTPPQ